MGAAPPAGILATAETAFCIPARGTTTFKITFFIRSPIGRWVLPAIQRPMVGSCSKNANVIEQGQILSHLINYQYDVNIEFNKTTLG
jgi:hypothetical protein